MKRKKARLKNNTHTHTHTHTQGFILALFENGSNRGQKHKPIEVADLQINTCIAGRPFFCWKCSIFMNCCLILVAS